MKAGAQKLGGGLHVCSIMKKNWIKDMGITLLCLLLTLSIFCWTQLNFLKKFLRYNRNVGESKSSKTKVGVDLFAP